MFAQVDLGKAASDGFSRTLYLPMLKRRVAGEDILGRKLVADAVLDESRQRAYSPVRSAFDKTRVQERFEAFFVRHPGLANEVQKLVTRNGHRHGIPLMRGRFVDGKIAANAASA